MTSRTRTRHRWLAAAVACVVAATVAATVAVTLLGALPARSQMPSPSLRSLSGRVTDTSHEPIRGAVVQLRNSNTLEVVTYLTDENGRYNFKRMDGNVDYEVWVIFRGQPTAARSISKFDSHMIKVIDFTVRVH